MRPRRLPRQSTPSIAFTTLKQSEQDRERREDDERQHANVPRVSGHRPTVPLRAMSFHVRPSRYY